MLKIHQDVELTIEKPAAGGRMIARHEGQVVLVGGAIPGERVRVRVERAERSLAYAIATDILEPSPDRRPLTADWACGGNAYAFIQYGRQLALKAEVIADAFVRIGKMPLEQPVGVTPSREDGYRLRARLQIENGRLGFYREGSHDLCDPSTTGQLLPETARALEQAAFRLRKIDARSVIALEVAENIGADQRVLHLQLRPASHLRTTSFTPMASVPGVTGASCQIASGAPVIRLGGSPTVSDPISAFAGTAATVPGDLTLARHASSFFQGNRYMMPALVGGVLAQVPTSGAIVDLYAGVGLFALTLAARGQGSITAVEGDRTSFSDLDENAKPFGDAVRAVHMSVEGFLRDTPPDGDTVVMDPPRTGVSREALDRVLAWGPPRLVYVSCDVATLARDVRQAVDHGYSLDHIEAFDLFPNTAHIETLVVLAR